MTAKTMKTVKADRFRDESGQYGYEMHLTLPDQHGATTSDWFLFPAQTSLMNISIVPDPTGGSGYIETTKESFDDVFNNRIMTGRLWPDGDVSIETNNILYPVTAWRAVRTSGVINIKAVSR